MTRKDALTLCLPAFVLGAFLAFGARGGLLAAQDDEAQSLVKQLGSERFADREKAQKQLRDLGVKALPALKAGMADASLEVKRRIELVRGAITQDRLLALYVPIAGDDTAARKLFAEIVSTPRAVAAIEAALDNSARTDELYRDRTAELMRIAAGHPPFAANGKPEVPKEPDVWAASPPSLGDIAGWLLLGALQSGKAAWQPVTHKGWEDRLSSDIPFLPEDDYTSAQPIAAAYEGPMAGPLKKLTAAWVLRRRENDGLRAGLTLAIRYDIAEAVAAARAVLAHPQSKEIEAQNLAAAVILVGLHGDKNDRPLLTRHAANERVFVSIIDSSVKINRLFPPIVTDGRDLVCQVRDAVVTTMCKLDGRDPAILGFPLFPKVKHANGRPMALSSSTAVGFKSKAAREAAFAKAADWLKPAE